MPAAKGFLHWSNNFDEVQDFEGQIRGLAGGTGLMTNSQFNAGTRSQPLGDSKAGVSNDLDALAAYVASLNTFASSPHRNADGSLTAAATPDENCSSRKTVRSCHGGTAFTNQWKQQSAECWNDSGGQRQALWAAADRHRHSDAARRVGDGPYLHLGSAATIWRPSRPTTDLAVTDPN